MEKLWSSANARIYGGGVDDPAFLRRLSDLIGTAERLHRTASIGHGRRTITRTTQDKPILTPAELRELPQGRAVVFASGTPAVLTHPIPWREGATPPPSTPHSPNPARQRRDHHRARRRPGRRLL
ncbi:TraM recognition domain-containing protein [Friedmanniella luteola]|uniref:TraM recognition domain-containing protein n=1 Tax=Friedmanniella luteola TaxID=546871 RepID=UPI003CC9FF40